MTFSVQIELQHAFTVHAPAAEAYRLLRNVPESARHFPRVEQLLDLGDATYQWEMERVGTEQVNFQIVYACRYRFDDEQQRIGWTPVAGVGNAQISGEWQVQPAAGASQLLLQLRGELQLPFPGVMKMLVTPIVRKEFQQLVQTYTEQLAGVLGGPA